MKIRGKTRMLWWDGDDWVGCVLSYSDDTTIKSVYFSVSTSVRYSDTGVIQKFTGNLSFYACPMRPT